jgi:hypothetical protein
MLRRSIADGLSDQDSFFNGLFDSPEAQAVIEADIDLLLNFDGIRPSFMSETVIK